MKSSSLSARYYLTSLVILALVTVSLWLIAIPSAAGRFVNTDDSVAPLSRAYGSGLFAGIMPATGATIVVNSTAQSPGSSGDCTLGEAIDAANSDKRVDGCDAGSPFAADTIKLLDGQFTLTKVDNSHPRVGPVGLPLITSDIVIQGAGAGQTTIQRDPNASEFFGLLALTDVTGGSLVINDLTLRGGRGVTNGQRGGAVFLGDKTASFNRVTFDDNAATRGGAIASLGVATATVNNCTFTHNQATVSYGGAIEAARLTISESTFNENLAQADGGAINLESGLGVIKITDSVFTDNVINGGEGGAVKFWGSVTINRSRFEGNQAKNNGAAGAIAAFGNVEIRDSRIVNNQSDQVGGIRLGRSDTGPYQSFLITGCDISRNIGRSVSGGLRLDGGEFGDYNGTISNTTISGNDAKSDAGGIYARDNVVLNLVNTTIDGNNSGANGGGLYLAEYNNGHVRLALNNVTVTGNSAVVSGGGIYRYNGGDLDLRNSIVALNTSVTNSGPDLSTAVIKSRGYNLIGIVDGSNFVSVVGDQTGTAAAPLDPRLSPLQNNGGPTSTRVPLPGSRAIDTANPTTPGSGGDSCALADQRNVNRPQDGDGDVAAICDVGAVEKDSTPTPTPTPTPIPTATPTPTPIASPTSTPTPTVTPAPAPIRRNGRGRIAFVSHRDGNDEIYVMSDDGSGQMRLTNEPGEDAAPSWSPDGTKIAFRSNRDGPSGGYGEIYVMKADGSGLTNLTYHPAFDSSPVWSPDGTKIVFTSDRSANTEIWVMNADGTEPKNLTNNPAYDYQPAWSPDGTKIAFRSLSEDGAAIFVMNSDGTGQTKLTNSNADADPAWSPDGTKIAFTSAGDVSSEIFLMNSDGSGRTQLTDNTANGLQPAWAAGGTKIIFTSFQDDNFEIYVMNADGSGQTRLTNNLVKDITAAWTSDDAKIAFVSSRDGGDSEIYVMNPDGTAQRPLTNNTVDDSNPAWSPDGEWLAFARVVNQNVDIYVMKADGANQKRLTNNPAADNSPAWSPDGTRIAFSSERDGNWEIYVMNADGTGQTNITRNPAFDSEPTWSPDGTKIAFTSGRGGLLDIYVMNADGNGQMRLSPDDNEIDFEPAWSPDGKRIAFISDHGAFDINSYEVFVMDANGSHRTRLTSNSVTDNRPSWSPDGTMITFASRGNGSHDICLMNDDGTGQTNITNDLTEDFQPAWSPFRRVLRVVGADNAAAASTVTLPIELIAEGDENALAFNLTFDPALLGAPTVKLGEAAAGAIVNFNLSLVPQGRLGVALALPAGTTFKPGVRRVVEITFATASVASPTTTIIGFAGEPLSPEISDEKAHSVLFSTVAGSVTLRTGFEADVAPRPFGNNDGKVTVSDWTQVGRFAVELDTAARGSEFQRADCAPHENLGDGVIDTADFVQAGLYTALLNPVVHAGGPSEPNDASQAQMKVTQQALAGSGATLRFTGTTFSAGQPNKLVVELEAAQDGINAVGFSVNFDPARLKYVAVEPAGGAALIINAQGAANGRIGLIASLPAGQMFAAGTRQLVKLTFNATTQTGSSTINFGDQPVAREAVSARADIVPATFTPTTVSVGTPAVGPSMQFSSAAFAISEGAHFTGVTVTRTGDPAKAASVDYVTSDGTASQRTDYTFAAATLHFAPGEMSREIRVLIVDDSRPEPDETILVNLSNPSGGITLANPSTAILTVRDDDASPTLDNPVDAAEFFVRQHYLDFLGREPDQAGLRFWTNEITECESRPELERPGCREVKRINVSAAFFLSIEFQTTGFLVQRLERASFGRLPNYASFLRDTRRVAENVIVNEGNWRAQLEANTRDFVDEWAHRTEFRALYDAKTDAEYVDTLFRNAGGTPSAEERAALLAGLASGAETRATILRKIAEHPSVVRAQFNPAFVYAEYAGYLRRNPDEAPDNNFAGFDFWLRKLNDHDGNYIDAEMVRSFIISIEYRARFK